MTATQVLEQQNRQSIIDAAVERAAKEMADEIDFHVLADLYKGMGWTEIDFNPHVEDILAYEIRNWMRDNCKGSYHSRGRRWLFQDRIDAVNFVLKWTN